MHVLDLGLVWAFNMKVRQDCCNDAFVVQSFSL